MKLTYPKFEPVTKNHRKDKIFRIFEIVYHTITPVLLTYCMMKYEQPAYFIPVLIILFVRLNKNG